MARQKTPSPKKHLTPAQLEELKLLRDVIPYAKSLSVPNTSISLELLEILLNSLNPENS